MNWIDTRNTESVPSSESSTLSYNSATFELDRTVSIRGCTGTSLIDALNAYCYADYSHLLLTRTTMRYFVMRRLTLPLLVAVVTWRMYTPGNRVFLDVLLGGWNWGFMHLHVGRRHASKECTDAYFLWDGTNSPEDSCDKYSAPQWRITHIAWAQDPLAALGVV